MINRELKKGVVDYLILALVARGAMSGVDLVAELDELFPTGTIYPALGRLERAELIAATSRQGPTGRPRKEYDLSALGVAQLAELDTEWSAMTGIVDRIRKGSACYVR